MSDGKTGERPNLLLANLPNLAIFFVIGWGVLSGVSALTSLRPEGLPNTADNSDCTVEARYWQDPFFWDPKKVEWYRSNPICPAPAGPVLGLIVTLNGDGYADTVEARTQTRYAIVSAMLQAGYIGALSGGLNLTVYHSNSSSDVDFQKDRNGEQRIPELQTIVAWERFLPQPGETILGRKEGSYKEVRVFYVREKNLLSENAFFPHLQLLAAKVNELMGGTTPKVKAPVSPTVPPNLDFHLNVTSAVGEKGTVVAPPEAVFNWIAPIPPKAEPPLVPSEGGDIIRTDIQVAVLGPSDSPTLVKLVAGAIKANFDCHPPLLAFSDRAFPIFSPRATLSPEMLSPLVNQEIRRLLKPQQMSDEEWDSKDIPFLSQNVPGWLKANPNLLAIPHYPVYRPNGTDDDLLNNLLDELEIRQVDFKDPTDRVALVTESDTVYARTIPVRFVNLMKKRIGPDAKPLTNPSPEALPRVKVFTYLRGIDGEQAKRSGEGNPSPSADNSNDKKGTPTRGQEAVEGPAQYDYVRRMVSELGEDEGRGRKKGAHFRAIGVTGSDVYDKLVILRALKHQFPAAILFTTDLNAVYLQASESKYTRGLLVASHFGLNLPTFADTFQGNSAVAPFRNSYQTATYWTCLKLLNSKFNQGSGLALQHQTWTPPEAQVYETARSGFYPLSQIADSRASLPWNSGVSKIVYGTILAIVVFLFLANLYFLADKSSFFITTSSFVVAVVVLSLLVLFIWDISNRPGEEPFALFEGISTWPSTFIRMVVILISGFFIWRICHMLESHGIDHLKEKWEETEATLKIKTEDANPFYFIQNKASEGGASQSSFGDAIKNYFSKGKYLSRLGRTALFCVLHLIFIAFLVMVLKLDIPTDPTRGVNSQLFAVWILRVSILLVIILTYLVIDALALSQSLVVWMRDRMENLGDSLPKQMTSDKIKINTLFIRDAMKFVAGRTNAASSIIYYPFIALLLMLLARHAIFDHYDWPWFLGICIFVPYGILAWTTYLLGSDADRLRETAKTLLNGFRETELSPEGEAQIGKAPVHSLSEDAKKHLTDEMSRIEEINSGAFSNPTTSPFIRALLIPLGGIGSLQLLDYLQNYFGG